MLIIVFKPFKVGHTIEAQGVLLQLVKFKFCNQITPNNQTVFIPNGILSNGNITNYSLENSEELI
jgi:small conductance mechanosensitive channel